jgi:hypothetical protein
LSSYGKPSLKEQVGKGYARGYSIERDGIADRSALMAYLSQPKAGCQPKLTPQDWERLVTWMDAYAQRAGSFSSTQEQELERLRATWSALLEPRPASDASGSKNLSAAR